MSVYDMRNRRIRNSEFACNIALTLSHRPGSLYRNHLFSCTFGIRVLFTTRKITGILPAWVALAPQQAFRMASGGTPFAASNPLRMSSRAVVFAGCDPPFPNGVMDVVCLSTDE